MSNHSEIIQAGTDHIISLQDSDGGFRFFGDVLRHGPSVDWTTACMWSSLYEILQNPNAYPVILVKHLILSLQREEWGWAYNETVPSDPDSTLRVLQFLQKIWYRDDPEVLNRGYRFVITHQDELTGGIRTYTTERLKRMWYPLWWWDQPHPCVSALAYNVLPDFPERVRLWQYLRSLPDTKSYWWDSDAYVEWELNKAWDKPIVSDIQDDTVNIAIHLLGTQKNIWNKRWMVFRLLQHFDSTTGSFGTTNMFHIPPSNLPVWISQERKRIIPETRWWFSTSTAVLALQRTLV